MIFFSLILGPGFINLPHLKKRAEENSVSIIIKKKKNPLQTKEITESKLKAIALAAESANAFYFRPHQLFFLLSPFNPNILELGFIVLKKKKKGYYSPRRYQNNTQVSIWSDWLRLILYKALNKSYQR